MSNVNVPLINVTIRRDANTITPVTIPPYEMIVLRKLFGKENVSEGDAAGVISIDGDGEFERLSAKYGSDVVANVYGDDEGARLAELVEKVVVEDEPLAKQAAGKKAAPATDTQNA